MRINHVAITVNNLDESVKWYREKLGFALQNEYRKDGMQLALLARDEVKLELFCFEQNLRILPVKRMDLMHDLHEVGTKHLCIEVEELDKEIEKLKNSGVDVIMDVDQAAFGGHYTFIHDCNSILIELYQPERGNYANHKS